MMRSAAHPCPACGRIRQRWQEVCRSCWRRSPDDLRQALLDARFAKAPHRVAAASIALVAWLREHPVSAAIDRVCGDHDPPTPT